MKQQWLTAGLLLVLGTYSQAATILQTKAKSAIIQVTESELNDLHLAAGQTIQFSVGGKNIQAAIVKVAKDKILVKSNADLTGQDKAAIELSIPLGAAAATTPAAPMQEAAPVQTAAPTKKTHASSSGKSYAMKKPWIAGVNLQYVTGSAKVQYADLAVGVAGPSYSFSVTGFDLSGTGIYYFGQWGVGAEAEYATLKGKDSSNSANVTQMQLSGLAEYKITPAISAGALLTIASNLKLNDNAGNDSSLNGTGFGIFGTYQVMPQVRLILDYRTVSYKLDGNTVTSSDIRLGGGYYF